MLNKCHLTACEICETCTKSRTINQHAYKFLINFNFSFIVSIFILGPFQGNDDTFMYFLFSKAKKFEPSIIV